MGGWRSCVRQTRKKIDTVSKAFLSLKNIGTLTNWTGREMVQFPNYLFKLCILENFQVNQNFLLTEFHCTYYNLNKLLNSRQRGPRMASFSCRPSCLGRICDLLFRWRHSENTRSATNLFQSSPLLFLAPQNKDVTPRKGDSAVPIFLFTCLFFPFIIGNGKSCTNSITPREFPLISRRKEERGVKGERKSDF